MKIVVLGTQPEYLVGLRAPLLRHLKEIGHDVHAIGAADVPAVASQLDIWGIAYHVAPISRTGLNPLNDLRALLSLWTTLRRIKPDVFLAYTIKPVVFGLPVAALAGIPRRYALIAGRGFAFLPGKEWKRRIARMLATLFYRFGLRFATGVMFQNEDDRSLFQTSRMIGKKAITVRVNGSGVDLDHYESTPLPTGPMTFVMISRLIKDKGVVEFVEAARLVKLRYPDSRFIIVGPADPSPNAICPTVIEQWRRENIVELAGQQDDVRPWIASGHVYVLPSYGEGLPRSVLEAMAMGRAIITTQTSGCRDTVIDGTNGYLVPVGDSSLLADRMQQFIVTPTLAASMATASLSYVRATFDVKIVNRQVTDFMGLS